MWRVPAVGSIWGHGSHSLLLGDLQVVRTLLKVCLSLVPSGPDGVTCLIPAMPQMTASRPTQGLDNEGHKVGPDPEGGCRGSVRGEHAQPSASGSIRSTAVMDRIL